MTNGTISTHGTIADSKQALVTDLKNVASDAGNLISNVAATGADELAQARTNLEARLGQAKTRLIDASLAVSDKAKGTVDATDQFVRDNPWKVLGLAAAAGIVIGAILSRR